MEKVDADNSCDARGEDAATAVDGGWFGDDNVATTSSSKNLMMSSIHTATHEHEGNEGLDSSPATPVASPSQSIAAVVQEHRGEEEAQSGEGATELRDTHESGDSGDSVHVVNVDSNSGELARILEDADMPPDEVIEVREGRHSVRIPGAFLRTSSPPPSTRRRLHTRNSDISTSRSREASPHHSLHRPMTPDSSRSTPYSHRHRSRSPPWTLQSSPPPHELGNEDSLAQDQGQDEGVAKSAPAYTASAISACSLLSKSSPSLTAVVSAPRARTSNGLGQRNQKESPSRAPRVSDAKNQHAAHHERAPCMSSDGRWGLRRMTTDGVSWSSQVSDEEAVQSDSAIMHSASQRRVRASDSALHRSGGSNRKKRSQHKKRLSGERHDLRALLRQGYDSTPQGSMPAIARDADSNFESNGSDVDGEERQDSRSTADLTNDRLIGLAMSQEQTAVDDDDNDEEKADNADAKRVNVGGVEDESDDDDDEEEEDDDDEDDDDEEDEDGDIEESEAEGEAIHLQQQQQRQQRQRQQQAHSIPFDRSATLPQSNSLSEDDPVLTPASQLPRKHHHAHHAHHRFHQGFEHRQEPSHRRAKNLSHHEQAHMVRPFEQNDDGCIADTMSRGHEPMCLPTASTHALAYPRQGLSSHTSEQGTRVAHIFSPSHASLHGTRDHVWPEERDEESPSRGILRRDRGSTSVDSSFRGSSRRKDASVGSSGRHRVVQGDSVQSYSFVANDSGIDRARASHPLQAHGLAHRRGPTNFNAANGPSFVQQNYLDLPLSRSANDPHNNSHRAALNGCADVVNDEDDLDKDDDDVHADTGREVHRSVAAVNAAQIASLEQNEHITIVAGGRRFFVDVRLFEDYPETLLSQMFLQYRNECRRNDQGDYLIENKVSPDAFAAILRFYRSGEIICPPTISLVELKSACSYFLIPFDHSVIKCDNLGTLLHELSNNGAKSQFEMFLNHSLVAAMAKFAEVGDRKCHIVVLGDEQTVEWDEDIPPKHGEQFCKVVHNTALSRFLMSYENRTIARAVLKEKGLKRILIGIEGFPIFVQRRQADQHGNTLEAEYFYDQRPFLKASWEKQESKSRHVDFELVRTNTSTSVLSTVVT